MLKSKNGDGFNPLQINEVGNICPPGRMVHEQWLKYKHKSNSQFPSQGSWSEGWLKIP